MSRALALLRRRDFFCLWAGQVISQVGDRVHVIAFLWFLYSCTGSAMKTGLGLICSSLPGVLLGPLAGSFVDRHNRRAIMIAADIVRGVVVAAVAAAAWRGTLEPLGLYAATVVVSSVSAFFNPALLSSVPNVVEDRDLPAANSLMQISSHFSGFLGPFAGGILIAAVGVSAAFAINASSFFASALFLAALRLPRCAPGTGKNLMHDILDGFRHLRSRPLIAPLLCLFAVVNFFTVSSLVLLPIFTKTVLQSDARVFGALNAMMYLGMLLSGLWAAVAPEPKRRAPLVSASIFALGAAYLLVGLSSTVAQSAAYLLVFGAALGIINVYLIVMFQRMIPDNYRGRIFALINTVVFSLQPVSYGAFGILADAAPVRTLFIASGACIMACAAALYAIKGFPDL